MSDKSNVAPKANLQLGAAVTIVSGWERSQLREWWHEIVRNHGHYLCYCIFLTLPADKAAIHYLTEYGKELDLISGENCLVIALSKDQFKHTGLDAKTWSVLVKEQSGEGYSVRVAKLFDIDFTKFPCLLIFRDIRSPDHAVIPLTGMAAEEISTRMRAVFGIIEKAVAENNDPLAAIENQQMGEVFRKAGKAVANKVGSLAEKTFEKAMEAWMKAIIK